MYCDKSLHLILPWVRGVHIHNSLNHGNITARYSLSWMIAVIKTVATAT